MSIVAALPACRSGSPVAPTTPSATVRLPIMRASDLDAAQLAAWFVGRQPQPSGSWAATEPLEALATYFIEEGAMEGVSGDVAFVQSVIETGWFRFQGSVPASKNNFAGIGATGPGADAASFPDARTGIRAQVQHLRAYADPSAYACTVPPLHNLCVDPRFDLVTPKGKASNWNDLGNGNWATAPGYGASIVRLYEEARGFSASR